MKSTINIRSLKRKNNRKMAIEPNIWRYTPNCMKKLSLTLLLFGLLTFSASAEAKSGCCSWHGGVDYCSSAGYYMCNDGSLSPTCTCGGYDYPSYTSPSYLTTPSCPLFASYSYTSESCECNYGYVASGGSCISEDDSCENQYGYHASSSFGGKCSCDYGYRFNSAGTKCVSNQEYCEDLDWNAEYDYLTGSCQCKDGYKAGWSGSSCVRDYDTNDYTPLYVPSYTTPSYSSSCPANSHEDPTDDTMCLCDTGYALNKAKTACVIAYEDCPKNSFVSPTDESKCVCNGNYQWNASKTVCQSKTKVTSSKAPTKSTLVTKSCKTGTSGKKCKCAGGYRVGKIDNQTLCVKK